MKSRFFAAASVALLPLIAHGVEYQVRGLTLGQDTPGPEIHVHQDGGKADVGVLEVKSYLNHEGTALNLKGPKIVLTTKAGAASAKDSTLLVGSCELPAKGGPVILLFVPEKPDSPACKIVVLDDSKKSFPPGSVKVANLSALPVKIELEKQPFDFKAGEIRNIENPPVGEGNSSGFKGTCETATGWQAFSSGVWQHPGQKRVLQVVTNDPDTKLVSIRGFRDVATPP